jgi:D-alanyl-D-alanine carboxypeptidase
MQSCAAKRLAFVFLFLCCVHAFAQQTKLAAWTDAYIQKLSPSQHFRGVILAERDGHIIVEKSYGLAVEEWGIPNTAQTRFEIASLTKQFTAAAILQLADAGKLSVTDTVAKHYQNAPPAWKSITIHQLLTHTSGLPNNKLTDFSKGIAVPYTPEELIQTFRDRPLAFPPGTAWDYTNTEYYLLTYMIEKVSGETYGDYLARHIFGPLKMLHSSYASTLAVIPRMADGYTFENNQLRHRDYFDRSLELGAGGIVTTVEDLVLWNHALDAPGFLSSRSLSLMFTAHPPGNYGYGWFIDGPPQRKIYHEGSDPGFAAFEARYPDQNLLIVVLSNEDGAPVRDVANALGSEVLSPGR